MSRVHYFCCRAINIQYLYLGSPFRCFAVNVNKVRPVGDNPLPGKLPLMVNSTIRLAFDVSQAGRGTFSRILFYKE